MSIHHDDNTPIFVDGKHRSGIHLALKHATSLQQVKGVPLSCHNHTIITMGNLQTQK
jgi:hypothetical protein